MNELNEKWNDVAPRAFLYDQVNSTRRRNRISSLVRQRYFGDTDISSQTTKVLFQVVFICFFKLLDFIE